MSIHEFLCYYPCLTGYMNASNLFPYNYTAMAGSQAPPGLDSSAVTKPDRDKLVSEQPFLGNLRPWEMVHDPPPPFLGSFRPWEMIHNQLPVIPTAVFSSQSYHLSSITDPSLHLPHPQNPSPYIDPVNHLNESFPSTFTSIDTPPVYSYSSIDHFDSRNYPINNWGLSSYHLKAYENQSSPTLVSPQSSALILSTPQTDTLDSSEAATNKIVEEFSAPMTAWCEDRRQSRANSTSEHHQNELQSREEGELIGHQNENPTALDARNCTNFQTQIEAANPPRQVSNQFIDEKMSLLSNCDDSSSNLEANTEIRAFGANTKEVDEVCKVFDKSPERRLDTNKEFSRTELSSVIKRRISEYHNSTKSALHVLKVSSTAFMKACQTKKCKEANYMDIMECSHNHGGEYIVTIKPEPPDQNLTQRGMFLLESNKLDDEQGYGLSEDTEEKVEIQVFDEMLVRAVCCQNVFDGIPERAVEIFNQLLKLALENSLFKEIWSSQNIPLSYLDWSQEFEDEYGGGPYTNQMKDFNALADACLGKLDTYNVTIMLLLAGYNSEMIAPGCFSFPFGPGCGKGVNLYFVDSLADLFRRIEGSDESKKSLTYIDQYMLLCSVGEPKLFCRCLQSARQHAVDANSKGVLAAWLRYKRRKDELVGISSLDCIGQILECPGAVLVEGYDPNSVFEHCRCNETSNEKSDLDITNGGECSTFEDIKDICFCIKNEEFKLMKKRIDEMYRVNLILDNLPAIMYSKKEDFYLRWTGYPIGIKVQDKYYVFNHLKIIVLVHKYEETDVARVMGTGDSAEMIPTVGNSGSNIPGYMVVGFEVIPCSFPHNAESLKNLKMYGKYPFGIKCDPTTVAMAINENEPVAFSYEVSFVESDIKWPSRWDAYLKMEGAKVHWFSILNSLMVITFLAGLVLVIFLRTVRRVLIRYEELDKEAQAQTNEELSGWKLVVGNVFRAPSNPSLLCIMVGDGVQKLVMGNVFRAPSNPSLLCIMVGDRVQILGMAGYVSFLLYYCPNQVALEEKMTSYVKLMLLEKLRECSKQRWQKALALHQLGCMLLERKEYKDAEYYFEAAVDNGLRNEVGSKRVSIVVIILEAGGIIANTGVCGFSVVSKLWKQNEFCLGYNTTPLVFDPGGFEAQL